MKRFYLGADQPHWLRLTSVPLFLSRRSMIRRNTWPKKRGRWAIDSGGWSELSMYGRYSVTARQYTAEVRTWTACVGKPDFVACLDWLCDPPSVSKTQLSVKEHQKRTTDSYLELMRLDPTIPWMPVLQGWTAFEYFQHFEEYGRRGVDLTKLPIVGVGSIFVKGRGYAVLEAVLESLCVMGVKCHGFGFKQRELKQAHQWTHTADSMAWGMPYYWNVHRAGKRDEEKPISFALKWREKLLAWIKDRRAA